MYLASYQTRPKFPPLRGNVYSTCSRHYARESRTELVGGPSLNVFKMFVLTHLRVDGLTIGSGRCASSTGIHSNTLAARQREQYATWLECVFRGARYGLSFRLGERFHFTSRQNRTIPLAFNIIDRVLLQFVAPFIYNDTFYSFN